MSDLWCRGEKVCLDRFRELVAHLSVLKMLHPHAAHSQDCLCHATFPQTVKARGFHPAKHGATKIQERARHFDCCPESVMSCPYKEKVNPAEEQRPHPRKPRVRHQARNLHAWKNLHTSHSRLIDICAERSLHIVEFSGHSKSGARLAAELLPWNWFADHQRISPL
jgi:hypothetical protein